MYAKDKQIIISNYQRFCKSNWRTLDDAYSTKASKAKYDSYNNIMRTLIDNYTAYVVRITGRNSSFYTLAAICHAPDHSYFKVFTAYNVYTCGLEKDHLYDLETGEVFYEF